MLGEPIIIGRDRLFITGTTDYFGWTGYVVEALQHHSPFERLNRTLFRLSLP